MLNEKIDHILFQDESMIRDHQANQKRIQLVFLPSYSSQLNLVEDLWKWMKEDVINNVFFSNTPEIKRAVRGFLKHQNTRKRK